MNHKETLTPYIKSQIHAGTPIETIKQRLIQQGWEANLVDEAIADVNQTPPPTPAAIFASESAQTGTFGTAADPSTQSVSASSPLESGKFTIRQAVKEAYGAIQQNGMAIAATIFIGFFATALVYGLIAIIGFMTVFGSILTVVGSGSRAAGAAQLITTTVVLGVLAIIALSLTSAFSTTITALAINDGAEGKRSDVKQTLSVGLKRMIHVLLAMLVSSLIILAPLLVVVIIGVLMMLAAPKLVFILFILGALIIPVSILLAIRLTLVPLIAIFEPTSPLRSLFSRASQLMKNGGVWFIVKLFGVLVVASILLQILMPHGRDTSSNFGISTLLGIVLTAFLSLVYNAVLVVFYRNRRAVNG